MAEVSENLKEVEQNSMEIDPLDEVFSERASVKASKVDDEEKSTHIEDTDKPKDKKSIKENDSEETDKPKSKQKEQNKPENKEETEEPSELEIAKKELEKLKRSLSDSQKWGTKNSQKLKIAVKKVQSLVENGSLMEDEAKDFIATLETDALDDEYESFSNSDSPIMKYSKMANPKLEDLREIYEDDELFNQKVACFDYYFNDAPQAEKQEILKELSKLEDSPLKLAKRMYHMGEEYYNEFYKDVEEAGSYKKLVAQKNKEVEKLQKEVDKLKKKMSELNEFNESPKYRIDEMSDAEEEPSKDEDPLDEVFRERQRRVNRR